MASIEKLVSHYQIKHSFTNLHAQNIASPHLRTTMKEKKLLSMSFLFCLQRSSQREREGP